MAHYAILNNDQTTGTLREELSVLWSEMGTLTSIEEPTEEDTAAIEAKQQEIDAKQQEIDNALCVVTGVITGVSEITYYKGDESHLEEKHLELIESKEGKTDEEKHEIDLEIENHLAQLDDILKVEIDNTDYWEGYYGKGGLCKRTSYNTIGGVHQNGGTPFRKNYAGVGYIYDPVKDAFYAPQPYESWTLNEDTCLWEAPVERPEGEHWWKEDTTEWVDYEYHSEPYSYEHIYPSWIWNTETGTYEPPVEEPDIEDKNSYIWSEENGAWMLWNDETEKWEII